MPRTLTNVGPAETYQAVVQGSEAMDVRVLPDTLVFSQPGEKLTHNVSVVRVNGKGPKAAGQFLETSLVWASPYIISFGARLSLL